MRVAGYGLAGTVRLLAGIMPLWLMMAADSKREVWTAWRVAALGSLTVGGAFEVATWFAR
jgi:hypothetical protein